MKVCWISHDLHYLRGYIQQAFRQGSLEEIPVAHANWISHLDWLRRVQKIDSVGLGTLSSIEVEGLMILEEEAEKAHAAGVKQCPHCKETTDGIWNCTKCGMALKLSSVAKEKPVTTA